MPVIRGGSSGARRAPQTDGSRLPQNGPYTSPQTPPTRTHPSGCSQTTSSSSSASLRVAVQKSTPPYTGPALSSPPTSTPLSTSGRGRGGVGRPVEATAITTTAAVQPSSIRRTVEGGATPSAGAREARTVRKSDPIYSISIQAAAASAAESGYVGDDHHHNSNSNNRTYSSNTAVTSLQATRSNGNMSGVGVGGALGAPSAALPLPQASMPPSQQQQQPSTQVPAVIVEDDAASNAKEVQRQQILAHANDLLTFCAIGNKVTSIRQCTSSFFVLLYQRLFDCAIAGIDRSPNTAEKRRHNVTLVLEQLRQHPYSLKDIEAEEVVKLNEDHISRLIMVFVQVAEDMRRQQQQLHIAQSMAAHPVAAGPQNATVMASTQHVNQPPLVGAPAPMPRNNCVGVREDYGLEHNSNSAYVPVGYTVAEVVPNHSPVQQQYPTMVDRGAGYTFVNPPHAAQAPNEHHHHNGLNEFYIAQAPPLNGGYHEAVSGAVQQQQQHFNPNAAVASGGGMMSPYEADESPSSVSYYLDSSVIPTDELLAEWYRNLVYPAPYTPKNEASSSTVHTPSSTTKTITTLSSVMGYGKGGVVQRGRPARPDREGGLSTTSSSETLLETAQRGGRMRESAVEVTAKSPKPANAAATKAKPKPTASFPPAVRQVRKASAHTQRTQLNAHDIMRRCQRLGEVLDAQEGCHHSTSTLQLPSSTHKATAAAVEERNSSRLQHGGIPVKGTAEDGQDCVAVVREDNDDRRLNTSTAAKVEEQETPAPACSPVEQQPQRYVAPPPPPEQQRATLPPRQLAQHHRFAAEPPLTRQERDFFIHRLQQHSEAAQRDRKIERLRAARYLGDMQQLLRRRMRHEYDAQMSIMRSSLKESMKSAKAERTDLMRRVRDENERYRTAYATLMEAAANEAQVPARVMSRHTAQLADYYATSLQHSHAICEALKRETDRRSRAELLRYAEDVSAWQQHFLL